MSNFYVEYHKRLAGEPIVELGTLCVYGEFEKQPIASVRDVLESHDRFEYYIKSEYGGTVGSFFITAADDMHHGKIAVLSAHWIARPYRDTRSIHRLVMWYVKRFCATHGIRKYQRTINVSSSRQLLITKEVS